ncbi:MAG: hypothetical protein KJO82_08105, partial [Gammaproteobacteria bacterium]|nr:hypothetical protein [Gammaproteobacteria bacterium]
TEMAPMDQPITVLPETTAAFIGRALRGPLNQPILVHSFGEYRRRFGDVWSRSSMAPAVQQFFEHGGRRLYVVRVVNRARGSMICLPASGCALVLRAIEPGSTECIRAAVDYDGIAVDDDELFNFTLQRIDPLTGLVLDQELFRKLSHREQHARFVADVLLGSALARVDVPFPLHRPEATAGPSAAYYSSYVEATQPGTDGHELTDYDLIGSRRKETGLFALQQIDDLDVLYLPPPGKRRDLGPASVLAAERYCRERGAMLVVDPPSEWQSTVDAMAGARASGYASPNMIGYFPRMRERGESDSPARAIGGAVAGLLCKLDRQHGVWKCLDEHGIRFRRNLEPAVDVASDDAAVLTRRGLNVISKAAAGAACIRGSVTMERGVEAHHDLITVPTRRLCLQIMNAIDHSTRWAVFENYDHAMQDRIRAQISRYLEQLADYGAIVGDRISIDCRAEPDRRAAPIDHGLTIEVQFQPVDCDQPVAFTLHQGIAGCRVTRTAFASA